MYYNLLNHLNSNQMDFDVSACMLSALKGLTREIYEKFIVIFILMKLFKSNIYQRCTNARLPKSCSFYFCIYLSICIGYKIETIT